MYNQAAADEFDYIPIMAGLAVRYSGKNIFMQPIYSPEDAPLFIKARRGAKQL